MRTASLNASANRLRRVATVIGEPDRLHHRHGPEGDEPAGDAEQRDHHGDERQHHRRDGVRAHLDARADGGLEPVLDAAAEDEQETADERQRAEHEHRHGHDRRRLVRVDVVLPAALAEERHDERARHVERGDARTEQRGDAEDPAGRAALVERRFDDLVLGEEAGERRDADDREIAAARTRRT